MGPLRAVIVDDEPLARDGIRVLLESDPEVEAVGECGSGREAVRTIRELEPDLVFLDVQMPEMNGFEVLAELEASRGEATRAQATRAEATREDEGLPFVIFVTAYDRYAIRAFEVHALDYVLKPYDDDRFYAALERAKTQIQRRRDSEFAERLAALLEERRGGGVPREPGAEARDVPEGEEKRSRRRAPEAGDDYLDRLVVKRAGRVFFVDVEEIDWVEAADNYVRLHVGEESHLLRMTMKEMEGSLDPKKFFRIHRSSIVRLDVIRELRPDARGEYEVVLDDGTRLSLSRSRRKRLERELGQRL